MQFPRIDHLSKDMSFVSSQLECLPDEYEYTPEQQHQLEELRMEALYLSRTIEAILSQYGRNDG